MNNIKILIFTIALFVYVSVCSGQTTRVDIPVAMRIDDETISVPFYINVGLEWCSCNAIDLKSACDQDDIFISILKCVKDNDAEGLSGKISHYIESKNRDLIAKSFISQLNGLLSKMWVAGRVDGLQNDKIYICRVPNELGNSWFGLRVISDGNGGYVWDGSEDNSLKVTIAGSFGKAYESDQSDLNVAKTTKYKMGLGEGDSNIYIKFNGSIFDYNVFAENEKSYCDVLDEYRNIHVSIANDAPDVSSKKFTKYSGERYLEWVKSTTADMYKDYIDRYRNQTRRVFFVLDADPVYIYFYTNRDEYIKSCNYDVVYKTDNEYKYSNFYIYGLADDFIKSDMFRSALLDTVSKRTGAFDD